MCCVVSLSLKQPILIDLIETAQILNYRINLIVNYLHYNQTWSNAVALSGRSGGFLASWFLKQIWNGSKPPRHNPRQLTRKHEKQQTTKQLAKHQVLSSPRKFSGGTAKSYHNPLPWNDSLRLNLGLLKPIHGTDYWSSSFKTRRRYL